MATTGTRAASCTCGAWTGLPTLTGFSYTVYDITSATTLVSGSTSGLMSKCPYNIEVIYTFPDITHSYVVTFTDGTTPGADVINPSDLGYIATTNSTSVIVAGYATGYDPTTQLASSFYTVNQGIATIEASTSYYYTSLFSQTTSILAGQGNVAGPNNTQFTFLDSSSQAVPYVTFYLNGLTSATTGYNGQTTLGLESTSYIVAPIATKNVAWSPTSINVSTGNNSFIFIGSAVIAPTPVLPTSTSYCVMSMYLTSWLGNETAILTTVDLPQEINGKYFRKETYPSIPINTEYGSFTFPQLPWGAEVSISVATLGFKEKIIVPSTSTVIISSSIYAPY